MPTPHPSTIPDSDSAIFRPRLRVPRTSRGGQKSPRAPIAQVRLSAQASPIHSVQAFAAAMFVVSMAACWIAVASTATAPLLAAGEMLSRAAKTPEKQV